MIIQCSVSDMKQLMTHVFVLLIVLHCATSNTCFNDLYDNDMTFNESVIEKLFPNVFHRPFDNGKSALVLLTGLYLFFIHLKL